jgi:NTE family protein
VLGAGGVVGHAFHAGVLSALADELGFDPASAEIMVGTSAGSVVTALLRAGVTPSDLAARALGRPLSPAGRRAYDNAARGGVRPDQVTAGRRPFHLGLSFPGMLGTLARRPWELRPGAVVAAMLPAGRVPTRVISDWLDPLHGGSWPAARTWICAVALSNGTRTVFGRPGAPAARLSEAVAASCAIPGFFTPVSIGGTRYVDGGVHSPTHADLLAGQGLDLVVVSSPMSAARPFDHSWAMAGRRLSRAALAREAGIVRRRGTPVLAFQPGPAERAVMGVNAMDPSRREAVTRQAREAVLAGLGRPDLAERLERLRPDA